MIAAKLPAIPVFEDWRDQARALLVKGAPPEAIAWTTDAAPDLFARTAGAPAGMHRSSVQRAGEAPAVRASRAFVDLARKAVLHSDPERFALLYRVLFRLQHNKALLEDAADPDVVRVNALAKAVRRDEHKMHAFVRFKGTANADGPRFVAWFEPRHHILQEAADFFVRRFAGMRWSIVTPEASAHWDGETLSCGAGGARADVPADDARDDDWRAYYESMFNPARLRTDAMRREMPTHYWRNLPEARVIPGLVAQASARRDEMVAATPTTPRKRAGVAHTLIAPSDLAPELELIAQHGVAPRSLEDLRAALSACRACPIGKDATQAVGGEGPLKPLLALVGEQPGDQEDLAGHPFVGPAGQVLDRALAEAGIERGETFVTNAVKHFKHTPRGKRRMHQSPNGREIEICRWWVKHELSFVQPRLVVALGASALKSLAGYKGALEAARGVMLVTREGAPLRATVHPSYLLRLPDEEAKEIQYRRFVEDLKAARLAAASLPASHAALDYSSPSNSTSQV